MRSTAACIAGLLGHDDMLVAVCGSNQRMHRQMIDDFVDNPRVRVLGFTDQMCAYMQASDLLISKAGGLTTAEAVASRTPLLYLNAVPGCESRNIGFMTGRGYALAVENDEELTPLLSGVISGAIDPTAMLRRREEQFCHLRPGLRPGRGHVIEKRNAAPRRRALVKKGDALFDKRNFYMGTLIRMEFSSTPSASRSDSSRKLL